MSDSHPQKQLVTALAAAMEEAEQVAGSTGKEKRAYAVEAVRAIAAHSLSVDDASFVASLAPYLVDLVVGTSKGLLRVNVNEKGEPSPRCCILS